MQIGSDHRVRDSIKHVYKTDGVKGFYKGFSISLLNLFVSQVPSLPTCAVLRRFRSTDSRPSCILQFYITLFEMGRTKGVMGHHVPEPVRNFAAGIVAVATSQLVGNPVDVLANRVMAAGGKHVVPKTGNLAAAHFNYKNLGLFNGGAWRAVQHILAAEGWRGLYHGYGASVALHAPTSGIWWAMYGKLGCMTLYFILCCILSFIGQCYHDVGW